MQAEQILGAECSQIHQDLLQCGRRIPRVTLLVAVPAPCTAESLEGDSGTSCLALFFVSAKHLALLWSRAVRDISCKHFHYASGKHTPSKQQQQTRGVSSYTPHRGGTPFSEMPQGTTHREA